LFPAKPGKNFFKRKKGGIFSFERPTYLGDIRKNLVFSFLQLLELQGLTTILDFLEQK
jgi:hypothetical protein